MSPPPRHEAGDDDPEGAGEVDDGARVDLELHPRPGQLVFPVHVVVGVLADGVVDPQQQVGDFPVLHRVDEGLVAPRQPVGRVFDRVEAEVLLAERVPDQERLHRFSSRGFVGCPSRRRCSS